MKSKPQFYIRPLKLSMFLYFKAVNATVTADPWTFSSSHQGHQLDIPRPVPFRNRWSSASPPFRSSNRLSSNTEPQPVSRAVRNNSAHDTIHYSSDWNIPSHSNVTMLKRLVCHPRNPSPSNSIRFSNRSRDNFRSNFAALLRSAQIRGSLSHPCFVQSRSYRSITMSDIQNISGQYIPTPLQKVVYGRGVIQSLPSLLSELGCNKAFIVTGTSLQSKTPVIKQIEAILGDKCVRTYSKIAQHAPVSAIKEAVEDAKQCGVDVFISVGGGSPIDSVKGIFVMLPS